MACLYNSLLMTNVYVTKKVSLGVINEVLLSKKKSDIKLNTHLDLLRPPMTMVIKFTDPMQFLVDISIYIKKIMSLGGGVNF